MPKTIIEKKELTVPVDIILEVAKILLENDITNDIVGTDFKNEELIIDVQYDRNERDVITHIECKITDHYVKEAFETDEENDNAGEKVE